MNGADLIAHILRKEGVEHLPAFPHSDIIDSAAKVGIRPLIVRQERHALHMADGYARVHGGRKICATTVQHGPGSENAFGAVAQCFGDNVPVLHLPGGYARAELGVSPNYMAVRHMRGISKWCEMVYRAERIPQQMQSAFAQLRNGRPGPVVLEVPEDVFTESVDPALLEAYRVQRRSAPVADPQDVRELVDRLLGAGNPVIVAGQGVLYAQASGEVRALAELTRTPVLSTQNGKSCFPENHALALGCAGNSRPDPVNHFLDKADLILGIGTSFTRSSYITPFPVKGKTFAQLTNWEGDLSKDYPVDYGVIGDAKGTVAAMNDEIRARLGAGGRSDREHVAREVAARREAFLREWMPLLCSDEEPINPYRVIRDLMRLVDRTKTVVTHDAGSPRDQCTAFYESLVPGGYLGWGKTTQLGTGMGLAQGAKLARPDWTVVNFMGDASIGMVGMDFETAVRCELGTLSLVLKNGLMGGYSRHHPTASEKYRIESLGGDYAEVANALGGYGERVVKAAEVGPAIRRGLAHAERGRPALLEFVTSEEGRIPRNLPAGLD